MSIEQFKDVNFRAASRALIGTCNTIIADYQGQGLRLTLRLIESGDEREKHLLYLGDHDPSGEDMVQDIEERLTMFGVESLTVRKLALTMAQIRMHNPPPNPTKVTDPRAANYIAQHGTSCWEVDALPPNVLARIIRGALRGLVDQKLMDAVVAHEERDKVKLRKVARDI